ncbi:MAG: fibronectin type III domain-containing protein [Candidatus Eiseniibacteriota bacterium]|nr:MAG: fibronectin type III domain-containing protein [Candidatus Eisenbacteria bacterium]
MAPPDRDCRHFSKPALLLSLVLFLSPVLLLCTGNLPEAGAQETTLTIPAIVHPELATPTNVEAFDSPSDQGGSITITWEESTDDVPGTTLVKGYVILRSESPTGDFEEISSVPPHAEEYLDTSVRNNTDYYYKVGVVGAEQTFLSQTVGPAVAKQQWFNSRKVNLLFIALILTFAIILYVFQAKAGKKLYIRRISGIEAVDEAVGRATEMGKPILFIPGIQDMDNVQTVAGLTILASVGKLTAQYETKLEVPVSRSLVMSTGRETLKQAYLSVGRPDLYSDDMVHYVTDEQFGYVAAVDGIMVREKPATCFYMGAFFAESLILAETGNSVGAIQIAGTAMPTQLPFFVAACDYTLIGEELFAASAYLSGDEKMIGSLKGQDVGKAIAMFFILVGAVLATAASLSGNEALTGASDWLRNLFTLNF